ncbi:hypothetical protein RB195_017405 [Necator americanus]
MTNPARHSDLVELVERFWSNESLGIVDNPNQSDDDKCLEDFNNSIKYNEQERRYSVKLPFKDQLKRGIIEEIDECRSANISHYLAHHGVISESKKHTKISSRSLRPHMFPVPTCCNHPLPSCKYRNTAREKNTAEHLRRQRILRNIICGRRKTILRRFETTFPERRNEYQRLCQQQSGTEQIHGGTRKIQSRRTMQNLRRDMENYYGRIQNTPTKMYNRNNMDKRRVLQKVASTYDPFGWISPVVLVGKIFIQKLWTENITWDESLPQHLLEEWTQISESWTLSSVTFPRLLIQNNAPDAKYDIHVFTDASQSAYSASSYLLEKINGHPKRAMLLVSKSRLAPKKPLMTIPKLELSGLLIGANLLHYLKLHLDIPIDRSFLWSDSRVALSWTQSDKDLPIFIRNRVRTIREKAKDAIFRHIPGSLNPADVASRGCTINELISNNLWWNGPSFLLKEEDTWPSEKIDSDAEEHLASTVCCTTHQEPENEPMTPVMESERFSKWTYMLRTLVTILTFITRLSTKATQHFGTTKNALRSAAEIILFRMAQIEDPPCSDLQRQLTLFKCGRTNLFRVRTRIYESALPPETKEPILLPRKSNITELFILHVHKLNHHSGTEQTLIELRKSVWIPKGRSTVKRVINKRCFLCRRNNAKPFKLPDFPAHPDYRVNKPNYPFENCGLDVMGPMKYKSKHGETKKCWILLITCLNCRAIVVDVIRSLSSNTFLHCLRRFIATNGCPKRIICDNAPAFKAFAQTQSDEPMNEERAEDLLDYCATNKIQFKFIPAFSPWQGGFYERMIGIFKTAFTQATRNRTLLMDDLHTLAKESEAICNSRPLTYVNDQEDFLPLRPVDFIRPTARLSFPRLLNEDDEWRPHYTTRDDLIKD